jgi:antitoxin component of RelBE/YafQ-DinJ toxin-antitoxin module
VLHRNGIPVRGQITRVLPAATAFQTVRTAAKLDLDVSKSFTMVANAVALSARFPRGQERTLRDNADLTRAAPDSEASGRSVRTSRTDGCLPGKRGLTAEMPRGVAPHGG